MHRPRIAVVATLIALSAAPAAPAYVAVDRGATSTVERSVSDFAQGSNYAEMAAHHEAVANRQWTQAAEAPGSTVAATPDGGSGWVTPLLLAACIALLLLSCVPLTRLVATRRRNRAGALA